MARMLPNNKKPKEISFQKWVNKQIADLKKKHGGKIPDNHFLVVRPQDFDLVFNIDIKINE